MQLDNYQPFLIGCVGAIAPEILRLYRLRSTLKFSWSWGYILISITFTLLGGFVSYILEPSNNYAAFYSGVGTPFIINAIAKETQSQEIKAPQTRINTPDDNEEIVSTSKGFNFNEYEEQYEEKNALIEAEQNLQKNSLRKFFGAL